MASNLKASDGTGPFADIETPLPPTTTESTRWIHRAALLISAALSIALIAIWSAGKTEWIPPVLSGSFLALVLGANGHPGLRRWSFTIWIATAIAEANLALSVTLTAISTLTAPIVTPLMMKLLAGEMIEIDAIDMMWDLVKMVLIPVVVGLAFHRTLGRIAMWNRIMPVISMIGIIVMTLLTISMGRDNLLRLGALLIPACFLHSTIGYVLAYGVCKILRREENNCRTIAFEVGMQNSGMAAGLAAQLNRVATLGLAPIVFGPVMNITASILANWWRTHPAPAIVEETW
ncbi:MAG: bile acid:sodium symporter [Pirellulales bacterium]